MKERQTGKHTGEKQHKRGILDEREAETKIVTQRQEDKMTQKRTGRERDKERVAEKERQTDREKNKQRQRQIYDVERERCQRNRDGGREVREREGGTAREKGASMGICRKKLQR